MNKEEKNFIDHPGDAMAIYRLRRDVMPELGFVELDRLKSPPKKENYEAVYAHGIRISEDVTQTLENLDYIFNQARPEDFKGHSLSVSDIVALTRDGGVSHYCCAGVGFREIPDFGRESVLKRLECGCKADDKKKTKMRRIER